MSYLSANFTVEEDEGQRDPRSSQLLRAQLVTKFGQNHEILVRNVSRLGIGAAVRSRHELRRGDDVIILLNDKLARDGTVKWVRGSQFGVELSEEISASDRAGLLRNRQEATSNDGHWEVSQLHRVTKSHAESRGPQRLVG